MCAHSCEKSVVYNRGLLHFEERNKILSKSARFGGRGSEEDVRIVHNVRIYKLNYEGVDATNENRNWWSY